MTGRATGRAAAPTRGYGGLSAEQRRTERHERLLDVGLQLFGTEGFAATSIERICATAGVSTRHYYQEFTGREALLIELHDRITKEALDAVAAALSEASESGLHPRIELAVRAYIDATAADPRRARVAFVEVVGVSAEAEQHRMEWRARWIRLLRGEAERAARNGEAVERDYQLTAVAIIGAVNELVHHWSLKGGAVELEAVTAELVHLIVAALAVRPA